jgi:ribokinase
MLSRLVQLIAGAGAVLLQREIPEAVNIQAAQLAAAAGVPVLLDAGGVDAPLPDALLQHLSAISPNETELQRLTGQQADTEAQVLAAAAALQEQFAGLSQQQQQGTEPSAQQGQESPRRQLSVLVKRGSAGSMMVGPAGNQEALQPAIAASRVVDTTGEIYVCCV